MSETENKRQPDEEFPFEFKTTQIGPISELSLMEQSLLFAELSEICYYREELVAPEVAKIGFHTTRYFERDGAQAYLFENDTDSVVTCRGTEPNEWNDIKADANATSAVAETIGRVHSGFKKEVDDLWPELQEAVMANENALWFTGHSLGGAMATISAGRCFMEHIERWPHGLFTYGSPRVGDKAYINFCDVHHYRWVNNNDIVTRVPPAWLGFRHHGKEMYLDAKGRLRKLNGWRRFTDRLRGFWRSLKRFRIDHFSDHLMTGYIDYIYTIVQKEREEPARRDAGVRKPKSTTTPVVPGRETAS